MATGKETIPIEWHFMERTRMAKAVQDEGGTEKKTGSKKKKKTKKKEKTKKEKENTNNNNRKKKKRYQTNAVRFAKFGAVGYNGCCN